MIFWLFITGFPQTPQSTPFFTPSPQFTTWSLMITSGAIYCSPMDGIVTTTIVGDALKCDYVEGVGTEARFSAILGFRQISKTRVVVADNDFTALE